MYKIFNIEKNTKSNFYFAFKKSIKGVVGVEHLINSILLFSFNCFNAVFKQAMKRTDLFDLFSIFYLLIYE